MIDLAKLKAEAERCPRDAVSMELIRMLDRDTVLCPTKRWSNIAQRDCYEIGAFFDLDAIHEFNVAFEVVLCVGRYTLTAHADGTRSRTLSHGQGPEGGADGDCD